MTQAAHTIPCDIRLSSTGTLLSNLLDSATSDDGQMLAAALQGTFAATSTLPTIVNSLDSAWEREGLIKYFIVYLQNLLDRATTSNNVEALIVSLSHRFRSCAQMALSRATQKTLITYNKAPHTENGAYELLQFAQKEYVQALNFFQAQQTVKPLMKQF